MLRILILLLLPSPALASFDWGGDCSSGTGEFEQYVPQAQTAEIGEIPAGKADVRIDLTAEEDVDVQLIDVLTGTEIIAWPSGLMSGSGEQCATWQGVEYCYSGYNGDQTADGLGNEWIEVRGVTNRELVMRAFGYAAGDAIVEYGWETTRTCGEVGEGSFQQWIPQGNTTLVGEIPTGKVAVTVELIAAQGRDLDVQLVDALDGTEIVAWPSGLMNGPAEQSLTYRDMDITWSGYNGIDGNLGHERIEIAGATTRPLELRAFGYQAGNADVDYEWGDGVGSTCMGIATIQCPDGLACKAVQVGVWDPAGECHTEPWCESDSSAPADCQGQLHITIPGRWGCVDYRCSWASCGGPLPSGWSWVSQDPAQCQVIRYSCGPNEAAFSDGCGCGCRPA